MKIVYNDIYNKGTLRLTIFLFKLATSTCRYWPRWFLDLTTDSECLLSLNSGSMLRLLSDLEQNRRTSELLKIWKIADITTFIVFLNAKKIRILASNVRFMESMGYSKFIIQFEIITSHLTHSLFSPVRAGCWYSVDRKFVRSFALLTTKYIRNDEFGGNSVRALVQTSIRNHILRCLSLLVRL